METNSIHATHFFSSEIPNTPPEQARFHVIGVPLEQTVSYGGGTAQGPQAILDASDQLELWNGHEEFALKYPIYTTPMVNCTQGPEAAFEETARYTLQALKAQAIPLVLGGEHSVSYGSLLAIRQFYGDDFPIGIIHFDAHCDLRKDYEGSRWSHACVMRRAHELGFQLFQIGTRAYCKEEHDYRVAHTIAHVDGADLSPDTLNHMTLPEGFPQHIYISFDVDGLDACVMPATGTPVPNGLFWRDAMMLLQRLTQQRIVVGMDVVELAPIPNFHAYNFTAALLVYEMMRVAAPK